MALKPIATWRLARWLGPWAAADGRPEVEREERVVGGGRPMRVRLYRPRGRTYGSLLLVPGLHFAGPDDPRMDRFAAILANAGLWVWAPFLPDFLDLRVSPRLVGDTERAFDAMVADEGRPPGRPAVFSISFGSLPALRLVAARPDEVAGLVVFGGYAEWDEAMRFCLHGGDGVPHDPVNRPVVYLNLVDAPEEVAAAWRAYVVETWGSEAMKAEAAWRAVAARIAEGLDARHRELFLQGCGAVPGGTALVEAAIDAADRGWLDPRPQLGTIRCPVHLVHGRDDDVIPYTQSERIAAALPEAARRKVLLTGLYGHTGQAGVGLGALLRELRSMLAIVRAIAESPDA